MEWCQMNDFIIILLSPIVSFLSIYSHSPKKLYLAFKVRSPKINYVDVMILRISFLSWIKKVHQRIFAFSSFDSSYICTIIEVRVHVLRRARATVWDTRWRTLSSHTNRQLYYHEFKEEVILYDATLRV